MSLYDYVNDIIKAVLEHIRIQVHNLKQQNYNKLSKRGFIQHSERYENTHSASSWETRKTLELTLEYMISSALRTTTGASPS